MNQRKKSTYLTVLSFLLMLVSSKCYADFHISAEGFLLGVLQTISFIINFVLLVFLIFNPKRKPSNLFLTVSLISFYFGYKLIFKVIDEIPGGMSSYKYIFHVIFSWLFGFCSLFIWVTRRFSFESGLQKALNIRFFILSIFQMLILDLFPSSDQRYFETFLFVCLVIPIQNLIGAIYRNLVVTSISFIVSGLLILRFSPYFSKSISFDMQSFLPVLFILIIKYIIDIILDIKYKNQNE